MISVDEATAIVLENTLPLKKESVSLHKAVGRLLAEDLVADRDFPPFHRVGMDGVALRFEIFAGGRRHFRIEGLQAAGAPQLSLADSDGCIEVMTGAILPLHTDTVVRYEDVDIQDGHAILCTAHVKPGQNVHWQSTDRKRGECIVPAGRVLSPAEINIAATIGKTKIQVLRPPRIALISTGDELVDVSASPLPHQIRASNIHTLAARLKQCWQIKATLMHLPDEKGIMVSRLNQLLQRHDVLLFSGAVSMGKFDFLPEVLQHNGVRKLFHKVAQRPGKPFWFGRSDHILAFAFPGNPVSTFMCFLRYFEPWLRKCFGLDPKPRVWAVLQEDLSFDPALTWFPAVRLEYLPSGILSAWPVLGSGSGDLANLSDADAFIELPAQQSFFAKGTVAPVWSYRL